MADLGAPDGAPPPDPRRTRFDAMSRFLGLETAAVALLCVAALVTPTSVAEPSAIAVLVLLVGVPVARVAWLVQRWFRRGDLRFALVGAAVLAVLALGWLLSR